MTRDPSVLTTYDRHYLAMREATAALDLTVIVLHLNLLPAPQSEACWGGYDALADRLRELRGECRVGDGP